MKAVFIRLHHPETNGKVERVQPDAPRRVGYVRPYTSNAQRARLLPAWLHLYNRYRTHTVLGGRSHVERVDNLPGN